MKNIALYLILIIFVILTLATTISSQSSKVICWGRNDYGQCNVPDPNSDFMAIEGGVIHSLGLKQDGSVVAWGDNGAGQCEIPSPNSGFVAIFAGFGHSLGLKADGSIVAWGWNTFGQCNIPEPNSGFVAISVGYGHSLGLKADGSIVAWGYNKYGQCNIPEPNSGFVAISSGWQHSLGLKADGSIEAWGDNRSGKCNVPEPNSGFVAIAGGLGHSLGLKQDGSIVVWGDPWNSQVPLPNSNFVAIAAGNHSLGLKADGSIVAWGWNGYGACDIPSPNIGFIAIAAGIHHSLGLKSEFYLHISNPNGGEVLTADTTYNVNWTSTGSISSVLLEYSTDNGSNWTTIDTVANTEPYSYNWSVPFVSSDQCLVRVSDSSNPDVNDISDGVFTIRRGIIYVKEGASGDGTSWSSAYGLLQDALDDANTNPDVNQIWVGAGKYHPTYDYGLGIGDRGKHFRLINGVCLYGGFPDTGDPDMEDRDPNTYETILSGDIGTPEDNNDNCYHVFYHPNGTNLDSTTVLDGFTVIGGNTNGSTYPDENCGGGMFNYNSSPTVANCTFSGNTADYNGGGMFNYTAGNPKVTNCTFSGNIADYGGGGVGNANYSNPTVVNCTFSDNIAADDGGGLYNFKSSPSITNCMFSGNTADCGGGMINRYYSSPTVTNCTFSSNTAYIGGGMENYHYSNPWITNCAFSGNNAIDGGGMFNYTAGNPTVTNCTFSGNSAEDDGGGMWNGNHSNPTVTNCLLWGDTPDEIYLNNSTPIVTYSDIQGGWIGTGNINVYPLFIDPCNPDPNLRDYHLQADSPCINTGDPNYTDPNNTTDLDGNPRVVGGRIDMGVYEYQFPIIHLPDLTLNSEDIDFEPVPGEPCEPVTITATISNIGSTQAENIEVIFKDYENIIGSNTIPTLNPAESNDVSIEYTWPEAGFRLISIIIDPYDDILESDETNNSASKLYRIGNIGDMNVFIDVSCSLPGSVPEGYKANLTGDAFYRIQVPGEDDFVYFVKGGSVTAEVFDSNGLDINEIQLFTNTEGSYSTSFDVSLEPGQTFDVNVTVTDITLTGNCSCSSVIMMKKDLWIGEISFINDEPNIIIEADVYAAADNTQTVFDIPVSFYLYPPKSGEIIDSTQYIDMIAPGESDTASVVLENPANGIYCIEARLGPGYSDDNYNNNKVKRPLVVGAFPQQIYIDIFDPQEGSTISAEDPNLVTLSVTDDNGNNLIPCTLDTLILDFNGIESPQVNLKPYFDWDTNQYIYSWQPPSDANGQVCLVITAETVDDLNSTSDSNSVCVNIIDDSCPSLTIRAYPYWAKIGDSVQIVVESSELLKNDEPNSVAITDFNNQPISFYLLLHDPYSTRWIYMTEELPPETALGKATITVQATDLLDNTSPEQKGYFYVVEEIPDFYLHSEDISFSDVNPELGEIIYINALIHASSNNEVYGPEIPVTFYARHPGDYQIDDTQYTDEIAPGDSDFVTVSWQNTAEGWYIIEVQLGPDFSDRNHQNNEATRGLFVGLQCDFNGNGKVDFEDLAILCSRWLWVGSVGAIPEDIYQDGSVDFSDFAICAQNWFVGVQ